ncbi:MAG: hypothetical protein JO147_03700 [Actinobacteria bacterium]|nr:hypothetical protein [Actinomycetota bacterium]
MDTHRVDIEVVDADEPVGAPDDRDVIAAGQRRPRRSTPLARVIGVAAAVAAALVLVVPGAGSRWLLVGTTVPGAHGHRPAIDRLQTVPLPRASAPSRALPSVTQPLVALDTTPLAMTAVANVIYAALPNRLVEIDGNAALITRSVPAPVESSPILTYDALGRVLWLVTADQAIAFDIDLRLISTVHLAGPTSGAAAWAGRLYLGTPTGLDYLTPQASASRQLVAARIVSAVTLDAARQRLLVAVGAGPVQIDAVNFDGALHPGALVAVGQPTIAIAGNAIWVGGFGADFQLVQLDQNSLAQSKADPLPEITAPGVVISGGVNDIWIRGANGGLSCLNGATGVLLQSWPAVNGPVSEFYTVLPGGVGRLVVNERCLG